MKMHYSSAARAILLCCAISGAARAQERTPAQAGYDGYLRDSQGMIVRNSNFGDPRIGNQCVRMGYWTPARAIHECEPDWVPTKLPLPSISAPTRPFGGDPAIGASVNFSVDVFFDFDQSVIKPGGQAVLDALVSKVQGIYLEVVIVFGHTDGVGGTSYNWKLSQRRADAVKAYLMSRGINADRIYTEPHGKRRPIEDNRGAEGRARNRRVEIEVIGIEK